MILVNASLIIQAVMSAGFIDEIKGNKMEVIIGALEDDE